MNGFELDALALEQMIEKGKIEPTEEVKKRIEFCRTLAKFNQEEIYKIFDYGVYNELLKAYCKEAMQMCGVNEELQSRILTCLNYSLDDSNVEFLQKKYNI